MKILQIVLVVLLSIATALGTSFYLSSLHEQVKASSVSETTYQRVMRSGTLRCGYTPYSVGFIKDANTGQMSGIYYDVITRLAENLGLKVEWVEEVGWSSQIEGLNAKRYDLICSPVSLNSNRAREADFSIPLYYSPVHIWAKKDNTSLPPDLKSLNQENIRISTLDGEQTSAFAKQFFPKAKEVSLPQSSPFSDLLLQVTTGKADIVFAEPTVVFEFIKNNLDSLKQITSNDQPLLVVPNIILLPRGEYAFKEMIDNGLREMFNSHIIDMAIDKYEVRPNSYIRETTHR